MARLTTITFGQVSIYPAYDNNVILPVLTHCLEPTKTPHRYIGAYHINIQRATSKMYLLTDILSRTTMQMFHYVLTLSKSEQYGLINHTPDNINMELYKIADDIAYSCAHNYRVIYTVHEDNFNPHIHFIIINDSPIEYSNPRVPAYDGYDCEVSIKNYLHYHYGFHLHVINYGECYKNTQNLRCLSECSWDWIKHCISKRGLLDDTRSGAL